ncbi:MAG: Ig-like domain-containing protein, partial [Candidatus Edwardsbacteria bacterium]|nr:Ig-like domain-containing protein [Candidatus Edwardsbacteria bacterium]
LDSSWLSTAANGQQVHSVKVGDVNGDGLNEIVYAMGDTLKMLRYNAATGLFDKSIVLSYGVGAGAHIYGMDIGDFDPDHAGIEIAICTNYGYVVEVYWNGTGWSTSDMYIPGAQGYNFLAIGDFDPDHAGNEVAFSRFNAPTTEIYEIYGGSAGAWTTTKIYTSAAGAQSNGIAIGDYDATHAGNELAYAQYGTKQVIQLKKIGGLWYDEVAFTGGAEMTDWWGLGGGNANPYHAGDELVACNSAPTTRRALRIQDRVVTTDWAMNLVSNDGPFATRYNSVYIQARMLNNSTSPNKAVFLNRVLRPDASIQANTIDSSAAAVNPGEFYAYGYSIFADTIGKWAVAESMAVAGDSLAANDRKLNYFRSADLFTYPVNEGFETALLSGPNWDTTIVVNAGTTAPAWTRIAGSGANPTTAPHGGTAMAQFNSYNASSGNQARLVLWPAEIASAGYSFSFWMNHYTSGGDSMLVDISTDRGATWTKIAGYPLLGTAGWSQKTVSLNAYAGDTVVIALRGRSAYGYNIYIDDVAITSPPAHDFAAGTILAPGSSLINNTQFTPSAWFRNNGSTSENAYVYAEIKDGSGATLYKDSVDQAIAQFDSAMVGFAPFTPTVEGLDTMIYYSALAGDEVAANDRAARTFLVVPVLPLAVDESFENATFPPAYWDTLRYASGATVAGLWSRVTAGTNPACSPFTGAAMAQFNSFNAQAGNQIMLLSPYIATNDANQVNVSFAFYGDPGYATTYDSMIVDVTSDNGATWTRNVAGWWRYQAVAGWRTVTANLGGFGNDTIRVALRAKSAYGNNMFVDSVRIFDAPPQITYTSPADAATDVLVNVPVVAAFSEPIDPATLQFTFSDGATLWTDTTWNAAGDTVTLGHSPWNASNVYTFTVTAASDLNGNALVAGAVPNPFSFTTNADGTPPTAVVVSPAFGATDVALNTPVVVAFSEPMNTGSIDGYSTPTDPWSISFNAAGDTMTLTTATPLDYNSLYHVIGTAGTDLAGYNLVPLPCTLAQFTTIANQGPAITMVQMPVDTYDGTGPFTVKAVITDPAKAGISFTYMYYNTGGAWIQVPSVTLPADSFSYEIPGSTPPGTVISYYVYAQDDAGDGTYSPANAPVGTYQFRILDPLPPTALVAQGLDMSVDLDWAPPAEELVYDTDNYPYWWPGFPAGDMLSTRFTPKHYPCRLEAATSLWYNNIGMDSLIVHIYADDGTGMPDEATELVAPFRIMPQAYPSFTVVDLSSYNIVLASGDFHVGYELVTTGMPVPFFDYQAAGVRSLYRASGVWYGDLGVNNIFRTTVSYSSYTKGLALKSGSLRKGQKPNYAPHNAQAPKLEAAGAKQAAVYPTLTGALAMAKNINGYTVFRGDAPGGPYTSIGSAGTPVFLDNAVQNGTPYYYVVRASYTTPDTFSGYSNEATA